jgi:hypothetical protein
MPRRRVLVRDSLLTCLPGATVYPLVSVTGPMAPSTPGGAAGTGQPLRLPRHGRARMNTIIQMISSTSAIHRNSGTKKPNTATPTSMSSSSCQEHMRPVLPGADMGRPQPSPAAVGRQGWQGRGTMVYPSVLASASDPSLRQQVALVPAVSVRTTSPHCAVAMHGGKDATRVSIVERWRTLGHYLKYDTWRTETGFMEQLAPLLDGEPGERHLEEIDS